MTPEVVDAIAEIREAFPGATVDVREDGDGVSVIVDPVNPGPPYVQRATWVGFRITFQYPYADVYPHFVRGDLARVDGAALGEGLTVTTFENRHAVQVSRRSNRLNPAADTAVLKLTKVLHWLANR
ncbi:hypothetical protein [Mycolicibacterium celeriflavum]|uniref:hypothetical protein n=1 Tax=Mycolicibacterium celeriflavum TaxID=1249101 RepID=UPI003CF14074